MHSKDAQCNTREWALMSTCSLQACLAYNPKSISCKYWMGVSYASMGNFYEAVKSSTKVCTNNNHNPAMLSQKNNLLRKKNANKVTVHLSVLKPQVKGKADPGEIFKDIFKKARVKFHTPGYLINVKFLPLST